MLVSEKRRIYYISDVDISLGKGPSVNEFEFVDALLRYDGIDSRVVIPRPSGSVRNMDGRLSYILPFSVSKRNVLSLACFEVAFFGYVIANIALFRRSFLITRISFFPAALFLVCSIISGRFHVKTVGDGSFRYLRNYPLSRILVPLHRLMYRRIVKHAASVDMVTETHRQEFGKNIGFIDKCHVVPNMVNTDVFMPMDRLEARKKFGLSEYEYIYGYVGNDPIHRGAKEAIDALYILREKGVNVAVVIVGGVKPGELESVVKGRPLEHIHTFGQIEYGKVPEAMNCLDVGVSFLPEWHRGASEQKVRQYLACGVVPVVTPGGSGFVGDDGVGFVCEIDDPYRVAATLEVALVRSGEMLEACREYAVSKLSHHNLVSMRLGL